MSRASEDQARLGQVENAINTYSRPSDLKITDMRIAVVASNYDYPIIRIDTNQGVYGIGEVRDAGHKENALQFKNFLVGQNPCNIDMIFRAIKQFGNWGREGGGVSGIEIALWDLVGKVYGVPCYQFLGGKYRDKVRLYADTPAPEEPTPEGYAEVVRKRKALGLTFIKFDIRPRLFEDCAGGVCGQPTRFEYELGRRWRAPGAGQGAKLTERGIARAVEVVAAVRAAAGWDVSLCTDHFGHGYLTAKEVIRLGKALEPFGLAWLEDPMPWWDIDGHKQVTDAIEIPTAAGEELYLWDGFRELIEKRAVDIIHPDLLTSGGMLCAAAISSFVALEHHGLDLPFWENLVTGLPDNYMEDGYVAVPDKPGLGVDLNYAGIEANLRFPGLFEPTDEWNTPKLGFWQPDRRWDK